MTSELLRTVNRWQEQFRKSIVFQFFLEMVLSALVALLVYVIFSYHSLTSGMFASGIIIALWLLLVCIRVKRLYPLLMDAPAFVRWCEQHYESFGSSLSTALWFIAIGNHPFKHIHIQQTNQLLHDDILQTLMKPLKKRNKRFLHLVLGLIFTIVSLVGISDSFRDRMYSVLQGKLPLEYVLSPLLRDITVVYTYPGYSQLDGATEEGGDGSLSGLKGSLVTIKAYANYKISDFQVYMITENGDRKALQSSYNNNQIQINLSLMQQGQYFTKLVLANGRQLQNKQGHAISILDDQLPQVEILQPEQDLVLHDVLQVPLQFQAIDDFGIANISLVLEKKEQKKEIFVSPKEVMKKAYQGTYIIDVEPWQLGPGEVLQFYLVVSDNDNVSGPKQSISTKRSVKRFSLLEQKEQNILNQLELRDALIDLLAGELILPQKVKGKVFASDTKKEIDLIAIALQLAAKFEEQSHIKNLVSNIRQALHSIALNLQENRLQRQSLLTKLHSTQSQNYTKVQHRLAIDLRLKDIETLEYDIVYLDDLIAFQRIDELETAAKQLFDAQKQLTDLISKYKQSGDENLKKQILERIKQLKQQMAQLIAKMHGIKERLPAEYRNLEAGKLNQLSQQLNNLDPTMDEKSIEQALADLERMSALLKEMQEKLNDERESFGGERYQKLRKQLADFSKNFQQFEEEQKMLYSKNEDIINRNRNTLLNKNKKNFKDIIKDIVKYLQQAKEANQQVAKYLPQIQAGYIQHESEKIADNINESLEQLGIPLLQGVPLLVRKSLNISEELFDQIKHYHELQRDYYRINPSAMQQKKFEDFHSLLPLSKQLTEYLEAAYKLLEKLFPNRSELFSLPQQKQLKQLARREEQLQQQVQELEQKMKRLSADIPLFQGQMQSDLQNVQSSMKSAKRYLESGRASSALHEQEKILQQLQHMRKTMESAAGKKGQGMPMPLAGNNRPGMMNSQRLSQQDVEIPSPKEFKPPVEFREDILKAMKQPSSKQYKEAIKKYYRELVQ